MKENVVAFPDRSLIEAEAAAWLIKLDSDRPPTGQEFASLREWLERSPAHRMELCDLAAHWDIMNVLTELAVPLGKVASRVKRGGFANPRTVRYRRLGVAAATIVIGVAVGFTIWLRTDTLVAVDQLYSTAVGQQQSTTLADGSVALLNTNSQIEVSYDEKFRHVRLLRGEAHFTVAENANRPFRVFAGNERIQAVGTAFSVHLKGDAVSVAVTEGSVVLASRGRPQANALPESAALSGTTPPLAADTASGDAYGQAIGTLKAGQIATINTPVDAALNHISKLHDVQTIPSQEMARRLSWREGVLMFDGERLDEVVEEIGRYTTVSIEISDPAIRAIRIGGRFPIGATEAMFAALEANFGLTVTRLAHDRVVLSAAVE